MTAIARTLRRILHRLAGGRMAAGEATGDFRPKHLR